MRSFGLWYLENESDSKMKNAQPSFDLHVNFWSLEDYKFNENIQLPFLDIGLKIQNYKCINTVTFFCPFALKENDIIDLSSKMTDKNNANIIFNTDCETHTKDNYTIVEIDEEALLIFPLDQEVMNVYSIDKGKYGTKLNFCFATFRKYIESNEALQQLNTIYVRFRIAGNTLGHNIYFDSEPMNKSFESAFSGTRMIDFKINEKRNIQEPVRKEIIVKREKFAKFGRVHFLAMEPSSYEVKAFDNLEMSCRELEEVLWDDYFGSPIDFSKGHILAYHWKQKAKKGEEKEDFSCLIKINYSKTKRGSIIAYAIIVVALGIISSAISSAIITGINIFGLCSEIPILASLLSGIVLLFVGIELGKRQK